MKHYPVLYKQYVLNDSALWMVDLSYPCALHGHQPRLWGEDKTVTDYICVCELWSAPFCKLSGMVLLKGQKRKGAGARFHFDEDVLGLPSTKGSAGLLDWIGACSSFDTYTNVRCRVSSSKAPPTHLKPYDQTSVPLPRCLLSPVWFCSWPGWYVEHSAS